MRRSRRSVRQLGQTIDIFNIILGIAIMVLGVVCVITGGNIKILFPIIFGIEALVNLLGGIKQAASSEAGKAVFLFAAFVIMTAITVATTIIIL